MPSEGICKYRFLWKDFQGLLVETGGAIRQTASFLGTCGLAARTCFLPFRIQMEDWQINPNSTSCFTETEKQIHIFYSPLTLHNYINLLVTLHSWQLYWKKASPLIFFNLNSPNRVGGRNKMRQQLIEAISPASHFLDWNVHTWIIGTPLLDMKLALKVREK